MTTVYVLLERHDYEGENLVGVYATEDEARRIIDARMASDTYDGDELAIYPVVVGSAPLNSFDATPCYKAKNYKHAARMKAELENIRNLPPYGYEK